VGGGLLLFKDNLRSCFSHVSELFFGGAIYGAGIEQPRLCEDSSCRFPMLALANQLESLILAQNERWRHA
jgi:hypothetical protein